MEPKELPRSSDFIKKRKILVLVVSVVMVITTIAYVGMGTYSSNTVNVLVLNMNVVEITNSSIPRIEISNNSYFENDLTLYGGWTGYFRITYTNPFNSTIKISSIEVTTEGFTYVSSSPSLPIQLGGNGELTLVIGVKVPNKNFAGDINVTMILSQ